MGIKAWFKEHKKLVTSISIGAVVGVGIGVACKLIFKEDVDSVDVTEGILFSSTENFDKVVNTFSDKAMDATFYTLKDKIVDADKYANLDEYLIAIGRGILVPGGKVNAETGEVIFD